MAALRALQHFGASIPLWLVVASDPLHALPTLQDGASQRVQEELAIDLEASAVSRIVIRLTQHAGTELPRRGLRREWIEAAIAAPDWTAPDPDPTLTCSYKAIA